MTDTLGYPDLLTFLRDLDASVRIRDWSEVGPPLDPYTDEYSGGVLSETFGSWFEGVDADGRLLVLVGWSPSLVVVAEPRVRWHGPSTPMVHAGYQLLLRTGDYSMIGMAIRETVRRRLRTFVICRTCGQRNPPEHRTGGECHMCMEEREIIF